MAAPASSSDPAAAITACSNDAHHEADASDAVAPASVAPAKPPPAARLYRHALESIFAFLDLRGAAAALQVSRDWLAAVQSMGLWLTVEKPTTRACVMAGSLLGRHVVCLGSVWQRLAVTADSLSILWRHMAQLRELDCMMQLPPSTVRLFFPVRLATLRLNITHHAAAADVNGALHAVSLLPLLESFQVCLPPIKDGVSFAPLASLPRLRDLDITMPLGGPQLSDAQVDELRAMPHLDRLCIRPMPTSLLRRLLAQPHQLQWQTIALPDPLDDEAGALLAQLPSLSALSAYVACASFDFFRSLPNLVDVCLTLQTSSGTAMESLAGGLCHCTRLERLRLGYCDGLTAAHLTQLLPHLPRLHKLSLHSLDVDSLSFLAQGAVTRSLRSLKLDCCERLPLAELRHVHALRSLQALTLQRSFTTPMDTQSRLLYTPPSLLLPQLHKFNYKAP